MPTGNIKSTTDIRLPLSFIVFGLVAFVVAQIIFFWNSASLLQGQFRIPEIWSAVHLLLLGFAMIVAMGAMYQLVPVVFLTSIWREKLGYFPLLCSCSGVVIFAGLLAISPAQSIYGAVIVVMGICMFLLQMAITLRQTEKKSIMYAFILTALVMLFFTIAAGFLLAYSFATKGMPFHESIFYTHILFGVVGWFSLLIFGFSYKLVPMFSLSHDYPTHYGKYAICSYIMGLLFVSVSFWIQIAYVQAIGFLLLASGFTLFTYNMKIIYRNRLKRKLDKAFVFSLFAILIGNVIHIIAVIFAFIGLQSAFHWGILLFSYIMCWIVFSILGYLYKIVPFLWWTKQYADYIGKEKVPTLKEMINEKLAVVLFAVLTISVVGLIGSMLAQIGVGVWLAQGVMMIVSMVYAQSMILVLFK
ncbi:hypothetical protein [Gracilibacillus suaedae]|uniref:hypothetical protein n=1 Tax=Gracilibacillus suaedae TaxID=2820273 RepID=UPI001ABDB38E|nr:hypothetical protein [Gracilibacillus suaedae]